MCLEIYELDPAKFLSAPGFAWQLAFEKTKIKLDLLTDIDILLMVEKGRRGEISYSIYWYTKTKNKYRKVYGKNPKAYIQLWSVNNLYRWAPLQKLPINNFEGIKDTT